MTSQRRPLCIECGEPADETFVCDAHKADYADEPKRPVCDQCSGSGSDPIYGKPCFWCEGRGYRL